MGNGGCRESALSLMRMHERRGGRSSTYNRSRTTPYTLNTILPNYPDESRPPWPLVLCDPLKHSNVCFSRLTLSKVGTLSKVVFYATTM